MASSNGAFTVTINTNAGYGETGKPHIENTEIAFALRQIAQDVASGVPSRAVKDRNGNSVGTYAYGTGMINVGR